MASLSFEGEKQGEIVAKVKRWLQSTEAGGDATRLTPAEAVERGAELTKEALRVVAAAAPEPVAENDLVKTLTEMGYRATEATREAMLAGLNSLQDLTGGSVVQRGQDSARDAIWQMNQQIAQQVLRGLTRQR